MYSTCIPTIPVTSLSVLIPIFFSPYFFLCFFSPKWLSSITIYLLHTADAKNGPTTCITNIPRMDMDGKITYLPFSD